MPVTGDEHNLDQSSTAGPREAKARRSQASGCLDKVLLVGSALVVCVVGGGAFWIAEDYHVKPAWVFFAWNSILMAPLFLRDFRTHLRKPFFVIYLAAWAAVHGLLIVGLMRWVPLGYWLICILIEGTIGLVLADYLFGIRPTTERP